MIQIRDFHPIDVVVPDVLTRRNADDSMTVRNDTMPRSNDPDSIVIVLKMAHPQKNRDVPNKILAANCSCCCGFLSFRHLVANEQHFDFDLPAE